MAKAKASKESTKKASSLDLVVRIDKLTEAILHTIEAVKSVRDRVEKMEKAKEKPREVNFQILLGNGSAINYTCTSEDLQDVKKIANDIAEQLMKIYREFLGEHAKAVERHELQNAISHHEPEGYS